MTIPFLAVLLSILDGSDMHIYIDQMSRLKKLYLLSNVLHVDVVYTIRPSFKDKWEQGTVATPRSHPPFALNLVHEHCLLI
jgi:hypothetical protein